MTLTERIEAAEKRKAQGNWYPANGGAEVPTIYRTGRRLLWCFQPATGRHAYLDCDTDLILSNEDAALAIGR